MHLGSMGQFFPSSCASLPQASWLSKGHPADGTPTFSPGPLLWTLTQSCLFGLLSQPVLSDLVLQPRLGLLFCLSQVWSSTTHSSHELLCSRLSPLAHLLALIWVLSASPCSADTRSTGGSLCVWVVIMEYACLLQAVHTM